MLISDSHDHAVIAGLSWKHPATVLFSSALSRPSILTLMMMPENHLESGEVDFSESHKIRRSGYFF